MAIAEVAVGQTEEQATEGSVALGQADLAVYYYCGTVDSCVEEEAVDKDCSFPGVSLAVVEDAVVDFAVGAVVEVPEE